MFRWPKRIVRSWMSCAVAVMAAVHRTAIKPKRKMGFFIVVSFLVLLECSRCLAGLGSGM
ncbi:hypothetical protein D3C77_598820 [compost metagenome]